MSYVSNRNLTNVVGRIDYISNPKRQENIIDFCNLQNNDFWVQLALENQEQFKASSNSKRANRKAAEARELIIAFPQDTDTTNLAEKLCLDFKNEYSVDCACAIHKKTVKDKEGNIVKDENGNTLYNLHAHLIYSERERLSEPLVVEQKVAPRTYYYDAKGKKCKKADAVKVVPKGTITQKGCTRYFGNKIDFFNMNFVKEYKAHLENELDLPKFDNSRYFATKHIGKNNPKGELISEYNELISELNNYFDLVEQHYNFEQAGKTPKEIFCELAGRNKFYVPEIADIKEIFAEFAKQYPLPEKMAENRLESLTDDELIEYSEEMAKLSENIENDYNNLFNHYDCAYQKIDHNAYWYEHQNAPVNWNALDIAVNKINNVVAKYDLKTTTISNGYTPSEAKNIADEIKAALKELLKQIKELISKLFDELSNRDIEIEQENDYDISDSFY